MRLASALGIVQFCIGLHCQGQIETDAYITNSSSNTVSIIDTASNNPAVVETLSLGAGAGPVGAAVTPDGRFAYITNAGPNATFNDTVSVIDVATKSIVKTILLAPQISPAGVAITSDGKFAYVTNRDSKAVSVIDTVTNSVIGTIPQVGGTLQGVAISPNGQLAYVADQLTPGFISVINTANNTVAGTPIPVGSLPTEVATSPDGKFVYVTNQGSNTVSVIATANDTVTTISLPSANPFGVAVTPDGKFLYVTSGPTNTVSVVDAANSTTVTTIPLPNGSSPAGISITPNGEFAYVVNFDSGVVSVIRTADNTVVDNIPVGTSPVGFGSFIGPNIIVAQGSPLKIANDASLTTLGFGNPSLGFPTFVDFNGGTLQTTGNLFTSRTISLLALGGIIDTNGFNSVLAGNIINFGPLTKVGPGTLTLSGNNSYSGGTNIFGGIVAVTSDSNLGSGNINIGNDAELLTTGAKFSSGKGITLSNGGGTLASANGTAATYDGAIEGTGPLQIGDGINRGTVVLEAANSYSGGTTINGGILAVSTDFNLGAASGGVIFDGGTLRALASFSTARLTTLNAPGGTFDTEGGTTFTDAGTIAGVGGLTKSGTGTVILAGNDSYSGGTTINAGSLIVSSAQALGLGNVVVNGGVLRANSQPINVRGAYTQNAGGTLQLSLGGSAPGQYDVLNVAGRAALDGTLQLFALNGFLPKTGDKLTLILANGGVSGEFANFVNPFNALVGLELVYLPDSVVLEFMVSGFTPFALTPNEKAVARELDKVALDPREAELISTLRSEPLGNLPGDFERISPDSLSALYEISFSAANVQASNLENRFAEIRSGSTGFTSSLNISNSPGALVEGSNGKAMIEPGKNVLTPAPENRWGVWVSGSGEFADVNGDGNGKGYEFTTGGVTFGLDYRLTKNFAVGVALGYAHTRTNLAGDGNIDVNSGRGGLYAAFSEGGFYLNGYAGGAYNSYDVRRDAFGGAASGSTDSGEFDGYAGGGYEIHCGGFTVGPIASLEYSYVAVSGYTETGSLAPLNIVSQNQDSLRTNVGLSAAYTWKAGKVQLRPSLRASWQHEFSYSALPIEAQFASGAGGIFTVNGPSEGHDSALIDAGVDVQWTPTLGTYFGYVGNVGRSNYDLNSIICSVRWDF